MYYLSYRGSCIDCYVSLLEACAAAEYVGDWSYDTDSGEVYSTNGSWRIKYVCDVAAETDEPIAAWVD